MESEEAAAIKRASQQIWGDNDLRYDREITFRWLQGFVFADTEPSALLQHRGGPCGIIAPVQGMLLLHLLFPNDDTPVGDWRHPKDVTGALVQALVDILANARPTNEAALCLATLETSEDVLRKYEQVVSGSSSASEDTLLDPPIQILEQHMKYLEVDMESANAFLLSLFNTYQGPFGVLLFLYSLVLTRGPTQIEKDQGIVSESLVSSPFGHANQALVNLLLVGEAAPNVWDGNRDASGIVMKGISRPTLIGYLSLLEAHRYCVVGFHLKNPKFPFWVIGSETHFTLLLSEDIRLVSPETPVEKAKRIFNEFDVNGNGFIEEKDLDGVFARLSMDTSPAGMTRATKLLVTDGIVLLPHFLSTLFPKATTSDVPTNFTVYHYNGIPRPGEQIGYHRGTASVTSPTDVGQPEIMKVLWTKWSPLCIKWEQGLPSIT
eukprot:gene4811-107_t